jgi:hypothetical protein
MQGPVELVTLVRSYFGGQAEPVTTKAVTKIHWVPVGAGGKIRQALPAAEQS